MNLKLLVFTDGRLECLQRTIASANENLIGKFSKKILINDSPDFAFQERIAQLYGLEFEIKNHGRRKGFCHAIQSGWSELSPDTDYVFHLEDDFTFNEPVLLPVLVEILEHHMNLCQIALKRQAWGHEVNFGGFMEQFPDSYENVTWAGLRWCEHKRFFTTNPSLYPMQITKYGWPEPPDCEGHFAFKLWPDGYKSAFWGHREDPPKVAHIGMERAGKGY